MRSRTVAGLMFMLAVGGGGQVRNYSGLGEESGMADSCLVLSISPNIFSAHWSERKQELLPS